MSHLWHYPVLSTNCVLSHSFTYVLKKLIEKTEADPTIVLKGWFLTQDKEGFQNPGFATEKNQTLFFVTI